MDGPSGPLRHVTFRVRHDCPLAQVSLEVPGVRLTVWSGHRVEVVQVEAGRAVWERVVEAARRHAAVQRVFPSATGGLIVAEVSVEDKRSISRTLEAHQCL